MVGPVTPTGGSAVWDSRSIEPIRSVMVRRSDDVGLPTFAQRALMAAICASTDGASVTSMNRLACQFSNPDGPEAKSRTSPASMSASSRSEMSWMTPLLAPACCSIPDRNSGIGSVRHCGGKLIDRSGSSILATTMDEGVPIIDADGLGGLVDWPDGETAMLTDGALAAEPQPTTTMSAAVTGKSARTVV